MGDTFQSKAFQRPIFNTTAPLTLSNIWTYIAARPLLLQATEQYGLHYIIRKGRQFSRKQNYYSSNRFVHRRLGALDYLQLLMLIIQWHCPASNINATYRGIRFDSTPDMSSGPGQASDNANRQTWHAYTPTASLLPSDRGSLVHVVFGLLAGLAGWLAGVLVRGLHNVNTGAVIYRFIFWPFYVHATSPTATLSVRTKLIPNINQHTRGGDEITRSLLTPASQAWPLSLSVITLLLLWLLIVWL